MDLKCISPTLDLFGDFFALHLASRRRLRGEKVNIVPGKQGRGENARRKFSALSLGIIQA